MERLECLADVAGIFLVAHEALRVELEWVLEELVAVVQRPVVDANDGLRKRSVKKFNLRMAQG